MLRGRFVSIALVCLALLMAPAAFAVPPYPDLRLVDVLGGKTYAFSAVPPGSVSPTPQVYLWIYGKSPVQLTDSPYYVPKARFSPDGRSLAVNDGNQVADIDLRRRQETILVPGPRKFLGDWSPDGRSLCYVAHTWDEEWEDYMHPRVWIVDVQTGETAQIPDRGFDQRNPTWGPDGRIAYDEWGNGPLPTIRGYNPATGEDVELVPTDGPEGAQYPVWAPDGSLYYENYPRPNEQDEMGTIYCVTEFPGRGTQVIHNYYKWGGDVPEMASAEGDLFYYTEGDAPWTTGQRLLDHNGILWGLDYIVGLNLWANSITATRTRPEHLAFWPRVHGGGRPPRDSVTSRRMR